MTTDSSNPYSAPPSEWEDWKRAVDYVRTRLEAYARQNLIRADQLEGLNRYYQQVVEYAEAQQSQGAVRYSKTRLMSIHQCWNCNTVRLPEAKYCPRCGRLLDSKLADQLRYLRLLQKTTQHLHTSSLLELHQVHAIESDLLKEIAWLKNQLESDRLSGIELFKLRRQAKSSTMRAEFANLPPDLPGSAVQEASHDVQSPDSSGVALASPAAPPPLPPKRSWLEIILDPQSIQWLLASGGLLLVVGLIVFLASKGVFKDPRFMSILMGVGNIAILLAGWSVILKTRFHTAGRAITLLACLAMPLNLWFYHHQGLMTLEGHLWVPAVFICILYAASARVLKDPLFVYIMVAGITMTGLLIQIDLGKFYEIASPSVLLMALGLICVHLERAFVVDETSPFSRKRFGLAFFFSGQALIVGSLGLLLGAQIVGWLWDPIFRHWFDSMPAITYDRSLKILALGTIITAVYGWIYSTVVVRHKGIYAYLAAAAALWAQVLIIDIWSVNISLDVVILAMSITALLAIIGQKLLSDEHQLGKTLRTLGILLTMFSVILAIICYCRATWHGLYSAWPYTITTWTVVPMLITMIVARIGASVSLPQHRRTASIYFFCSATALFIAVAGVFTLAGMHEWHHQAPLLILIPIGYLIASHLYGDGPASKPTLSVARVAMILIMISVLFHAGTVTTTLLDPIAGNTINLWFALIAFQCAIFNILASIWHGRDHSIYVAAAMLCASVWLVFGYFELPTTFVINGYALLGLLLLVIYRLALLDEKRQIGLSYAAYICGNCLIGLSVIISVLMTLSDLWGKRVGIEQLMLTSGIAVILLIAAMLTRYSGWRRFHISSFAIEAALAIICIQKQLNLTTWQNLELFLLIAGAVTLISAHVALLRERDHGSETVSLGMPLGSLMVCLPLAISMLYYRFFTSNLSMFDEVLLISSAIMLFVAGTTLKVRATTLIGGFFGITHLLILMIHAGMKAQLTLGIYLTIGGGAIFIIGLVLSLFREKLLSIPDRYRARDGIFKVLNWR